MITVLTGPPCSGKSTYIRKHAKAGDLQVDFDRLATCLGNDRSHGASGLVKRAAQAAREAVEETILSAAERDAGSLGDTWIIRSRLPGGLEERFTKAGAQILLLDPGKDECLARVERDGRPPATREWIEEWYANNEGKKGTSMSKHTKGQAFEPQDTGGAGEGVFTAYASVFNNVDSHGDIVKPGAFKASLEAWGKRGKPIPLLFGHQFDDPDFNIGHIAKAVEDDHGLLVTGVLDLECSKGRQVYRMLKQGRIDQLSFAYDVIRKKPGMADGKKVNELEELQIFEVSLVTIGANQATEVLDVKAAPKWADTADSGRAGPIGQALDHISHARELLSQLLPPAEPTSQQEEHPSNVETVKRKPLGDSSLTERVDAILKTLNL